MIKLEVKDYCQNCQDFELKCERGTRYEYYPIDFNGITSREDFIITCIHREKCAELCKHIERNMKK